MNHNKKTYLDFTAKPDFRDILTNPILDIAARFWDDDRYDAFKICYRSMRVVDDLVDDRKATGRAISKAEQAVIKKMINDWLKSFTRNDPQDKFQQNLLDTIDKFRIPKWPWQRLAKAMIYDLTHNGFGSFLAFLRYSEGAAISPASIFMHLCGVRKEGDSYAAPVFDIRQSARSLALFAYIVHIIRDFQKDQLNNLNYFNDKSIKSNNLTLSILKRAATANEISDDFRNLIKEYTGYAEYYRVKARKAIAETIPYLDEKYQLSLNIIFHLYNQIYEKINWETGTFTTEELNPTPPEIQEKINQTIKTFL